MEQSGERVRLSSRMWRDDEPVLRGEALQRAHRDGLPCPKFGDGVWNLIALAYRENILAAHARLDFDSLFSDPSQHLTARELVMQRLYRPVAPIRGKVRIKKAALSTVSVVPYYVAILYQFMEQIGVQRLEHFTQKDLDTFARHLENSGSRAPKHIAGILGVVCWLYEARDLLTDDRIVVLPWGGRSPSKVLGVKAPMENSTPRIPEELMHPLLRWAATYVNVFSEDIINAYHENIKRQYVTSPKAPDPSHRHSARTRIEKYLTYLKNTGKKVPKTTKGRPDMKAIQVAIKAKGGGAISGNKDLIMAAVQDIGLEDGSYETPIRTVPHISRPWRTRFQSSREIHAECRHLTIACYIVCAYLSGMRDSEVQAIKKGGIRISRDADGQIVRRYLRSTEYKGRHPRGIEREWVVIEQVAKAIDVMINLTARARAECNTDLLFILLHNRYSNDRVSLKQLCNRYVADFINHVNTSLAPSLSSPEYPMIPIGSFMRITTRMFRRTVAWHIANRPFGTVAGMIQYGHMSDTMFEGYAGTSESGFRQEVEDERDMARMGDILEIYEDWKRGINPTGPIAKELDDEFRHIQEMLGDFPGKVIVDDGRRNRLLEHLRKRLYPGLMADCFFEPKNARCLAHLCEEKRVEPVIGICDPHCNNACWLKKHLPVWENARKDVRLLAKRNRISVMQREILRRKEAEYTAVIATIEETANGRKEKES